jgi:hypothetical protein
MTDDIKKFIEEVRRRCDKNYRDGERQFLYVAHEDVKGLLAIIDSLQKEIERLQVKDGYVVVRPEWIIHNHTGRNDHACAECVPHGDMIVPGFKCYYHEAKAMIQAAERVER